MRIHLRLTNPLLRTDSVLFARVVRCVIEAVILNNVAYLRHRAGLSRPVPLLYESGVRYRDEPHDRPDEALDIPAILAQGHGDCMHLCAWRVAELREGGESRARIRLTYKRVSPQKRIFHVQVRRGDGTIEDPSKKLGM